MTQYLIAVAVGPVQEFIAAARKLRDLWYGSFLLSELSKSAARSLAEDGCELIFPSPVRADDLNPNSELNVANKILALTPENADPKALAEHARSHYQTCWESFCRSALDEIGSNWVHQSDFDKQIHDSGEFFAAWVPYDSNDYQACRDAVEAKLSGRKNFRPFFAPSWDGAGKPKSSLDGIRETVLNQSAAAVQRCFAIKKGETLDTLGIVKRFGPWAHSSPPFFDNLAQVAVLPYLAGLKQAARNDPDIAELVTGLPVGHKLYHFDKPLPPVHRLIWNGEGFPECLPPELFFPAVLEDEKNENPARREDTVWQKFEATLGRIWKKTAFPHPYGALMLGDGDHMGEALNHISEITGHQLFSRKLEEFARRVTDTVRQHEGQVIYSGGDDVMAYVPLHQVLDCAQAVNDLFAEIMAQACGQTGLSKIPTFSMGVAVVHYRKPLHDALVLARKAERMAKQEGGRNALAVIQDKRSGSELCIHGKWNTSDNLAGLVQRLKKYISLYENRTLSSRLGYQLRELGQRFWAAGEPENTPNLVFENNRPVSVLAAETQRIIRHKQSTGNNSEPSTDLLSILEGQTRLRAFSDEIILSRQFYTARQHARGKWGKDERSQVS